MTEKEKWVGCSELAAEQGVSRSTMCAKLKRGGVPQNADGLYHRAKALDAIAIGKEMDKNALSNRQANQQSGSLVSIKTGKQIEKLDVEIDMLKLNRDKERGELVSVEEAVAVVTRREAEMATIVRVWQESEGAKYPKLHSEIKAISERLLDMMREPVGL